MSVKDLWTKTDPVTKKKVPSKRSGVGKQWRVTNEGAPSRSFRKKSEAEAWDTLVKADLLKGLRPFDIKAGLITFKQYSDKWLEERVIEESSRRVIRSRLNSLILPYFGHMRMRDIHPSTVSEWTAWLQKQPGKRSGEPLSDSTKSRCWVHFGSIMKSAKLDKVISEHPCEGVDRPANATVHKARPWDHEIIDMILDAFPDREHGIALVSATCGHRQGESFAVAREDIDFLRCKITIQHQVKHERGRLILAPPKGGRTRIIPLSQSTANALAAHIERYGTTGVRCTCCGTTNRLLFVNDNNQLWDWRRFNIQHWHKAVKAAGMNPADDARTGQHNLRHYYASLMIDGGGVSPLQLQEYLGHKNIETTYGIYGHLFDKAHERAADVIDQAFAGRGRPRNVQQEIGTISPITRNRTRETGVANTRAREIP